MEEEERRITACENVVDDALKRLVEPVCRGLESLPEGRRVDAVFVLLQLGLGKIVGRLLLVGRRGLQALS